MNKPKELLKYTEAALIIIVWVLLISIPLIFNENSSVFDANFLKGPVLTYIPLMVIFLINRFLLVPRLLLKKKNLLYVVTVVGLIGILAMGLHQIQSRNPIQNHRELAGPGHLPPPEFDGSGEHPVPPIPQGKPGGPPPFANLIIMSFLLVGFDTGLYAFLRLNEAEKVRARLEKENVTNQLDILRHQVSPHFLMNTLNNIHTLIDISTDSAKDAVIRLSKLMRYLLYDTADNVTTIKSEVAFIESYLELMKLRVSDKVDIILNVPSELPDKKIPPLLFTSFIENAFKHGISYKQKSYIIIDISADSRQMEVKVQNSNHSKSDSTESSGIGLDNARKRLDLLYGDTYQLDIADIQGIFSVQLIIPLKENVI